MILKHVGRGQTAARCERVPLATVCGRNGTYDVTRENYTLDLRVLFTNESRQRWEIRATYQRNFVKFGYLKELRAFQRHATHGIPTKNMMIVVVNID